MWLSRLFGLTVSAADKASLLAITDRFDSCTMSIARKFICAVLRRTSSSMRSSKQTIRTMMSYGENPAVMPASSMGALSVARNCEKCEAGSRCNRAGWWACIGHAAWGHTSRGGKTEALGKKAGVTWVAERGSSEGGRARKQRWWYDG